MKYLLFISVLVSHILVLACDDLIRQFPRDCAIQDRYVALKQAYAAKHIDIDDIAEYRVIRFVDRDNWERAKTRKIHPEDIYQPAPATWKVWDLGMRAIVQASGGKNMLMQGYELNTETISFMNKNLLMNEELQANVKDAITDQSLSPGELRKVTSVGVLFRSNTDLSETLRLAAASMERFQKNWESKMGVSFAELLKGTGALIYDGANMKSAMVYDRAGYVHYTPSAMVPTELGWILNFIRFNLEKYQAGTPVLSPIELATVVQKWFVSLHPFSDGNGRTSRAIQDVILTNFEMPFAPGGDLQEDATATHENYMERTYIKMEDMLTSLELCQTRNAVMFHCQTVEQIKVMAEQAKVAGIKQPEFEKAIRKRD